MATVLLATDADWLYDEVDAALAGDHDVHRVRRGTDVLRATDHLSPDLVVVDLQIGNMGGMAVSHDLRLEQRAGRLDECRVLLLLDRDADTFLAKRAEADGWLIKPLDSFRLRRAAAALLEGDPFPGAAVVAAGADSDTGDGAPEDTAAVEVG